MKTSVEAEINPVLICDIGAPPSADLERKFTEVRDVATIADAAPALLSSLDCEQRYRFVNRAYEKWFGWRREDVIGRTTREVLGDAAAERIRPYVERALQGEEVQFEAELAYRDIGPRWVEARYVPDCDAAGRVQGLFALVVDISERKRADAALMHASRQKEALYELSDRLHHAKSLADVYDAALQAIVSALRCDRASILLCDEAGVMRFVGWRGLSDVYRAAVEGHSPWTPGDSNPAPIRIDDVNAVELSAALERAITVEGIGALTFIPLISNGRLIGKFMAYFDAAHAFSDDEVELSMTIARQLAFGLDRMRAEAELRASERRFRDMIDALPAAIYTTDAAGRLMHFNPAAVEFSGRTPELGTDQWCVSWKLYHPDGAPMTHEECPMAVALKEGRSIRGAEAIAERPDGARRWFSPYPTPLRDAGGRVVGGINMLMDITDRKRTEEALKEADRRKDEFLAMLAHELRNPLAPITNAVHLLRRSQSEDPIQQQARAIIDRQTSRLARLVDDLLEVSRITSGRIQLHMERIVLGGVLERAIESARTLIEQHRHTLHVELPPDPVWLYADAARLEQVFVNLLNNAAKYTDDGGCIQLLVEVHDERAIVRVLDTGIGIDPELLPRIFDLFTQAERTLDRSQGGLGIGLSLAQRLVAMHGGTVSAKSAPGRGSEFIVQLPAQKPMVAAEDTQAPQSDGATIDAVRVLVVDDNIDAAQSLAMLLESSGHHVRVAHGGVAALECAREHRPDVVFLDIGLPELDGYEVARRMRRSSNGNTFTLVAMTGYGQRSDRERSRAAGFDHHLVKPADITRLEAILSEVAPRLQRQVDSRPGPRAAPSA